MGLVPYLERIRRGRSGPAGSGNSAKLADFDYSISGYCDWLAAFVDTLGFDRFSIVVHDWGGGGGLALSAARPRRRDGGRGASRREPGARVI